MSDRPVSTDEPRFVQVIGSYDAVFVGPFTTDADATVFRDQQHAAKPQFDFYVMTETEMRENVAEHGELPVLTPDEAKD